MRVMIMHNMYSARGPSGENRVVADESAELARLGHDVLRVLPASDDINGVGGILRAIAEPIRPQWSLRAFGQYLDQALPDIIHLHNPYPLIPPSMILSAKKRGIPVIQTLHNGRHVCLRGTFTLDGGRCTKCAGRRLPMPAVRHSCYRGSQTQSAFMAGVAMHNRRKFRGVDLFLAVSESLRSRLGTFGFPLANVTVKTPGIRDPGNPRPPHRRDFVFAGRLNREKGVDLLVEAWLAAERNDGSRLVLAGSGELEPWARSIAAQPHACIDVLGQVSRARVEEAMRGAMAVVVPSQVPETLGLTAIEAFALARPVVAWRIGALEATVSSDAGWLVRSRGELSHLLRTITRTEAAAKGFAGRTAFCNKYELTHATEELANIYGELRRRYSR